MRIGSASAITIARVAAGTDCPFVCKWNALRFRCLSAATEDGTGQSPLSGVLGRRLTVCAGPTVCGRLYAREPARALRLRRVVIPSPRAAHSRCMPEMLIAMFVPSTCASADAGKPVRTSPPHRAPARGTAVAHAHSHGGDDDECLRQPARGDSERGIQVASGTSQLTRDDHHGGGAQAAVSAWRFVMPSNGDRG